MVYLGTAIEVTGMRNDLTLLMNYEVAMELLNVVT